MRDFYSLVPVGLWLVFVMGVLTGCDPLNRFVGTVYSVPPTHSPGTMSSAVDPLTPLADVSVKLFKRQGLRSEPISLPTIITNGDGKFEINFIGGISRDGYYLHISKPGYHTKEIDLSRDFRDSATEVATCKIGWVCVEVFTLLSSQR